MGLTANVTYRALYTKQLTKKQKTFTDGFVVALEGVCVQRWCSFSSTHAPHACALTMPCLSQGPALTTSRLHPHSHLSNAHPERSGGTARLLDEEGARLSLARLPARPI